MGVLIVGLGNPGKKYEKTRHNLGMRIVEAFAAKQGCQFNEEKKFLGKVASCEVNGEKLILLLPLTFMNLSGEAVKKCVDFFNIPTPLVYVVCDDIDIPLGELRMRSSGSTGGHKGLKSIEEMLHTKDYCRLRVGIGDRQEGDLEDYVLSEFSLEEVQILPKVIEMGVEMLASWVLKKECIFKKKIV